MSGEVQKALERLLVTGRSIVALTSGMNEEALWDDRVTRSRVEQEFVALGRMLAHVREADAEVWRMLARPDTGVRFGAVMASGRRLDYGSVWRATRYDVPPLLERIEAVLGGDG